MSKKTEKKYRLHKITKKDIKAMKEYDNISFVQKDHLYCLIDKKGRPFVKDGIFYIFQANMDSYVEENQNRFCPLEAIVYFSGLVPDAKDILIPSIGNLIDNSNDYGKMDIDRDDVGYDYIQLIKASPEYYKSAALREGMEAIMGAISVLEGYKTYSSIIRQSIDPEASFYTFNVELENIEEDDYE